MIPVPASMVKDPEATLDYAVDWTAWLEEGDVVLTSAWAAVGVTIEDSPVPSHDAGVSRVWVSGGTTGAPASITNSIVTAAGRRDDRTIHLTIVHK